MYGKKSRKTASQGRSRKPPKTMLDACEQFCEYYSVLSGEEMTLKERRKKLDKLRNITNARENLRMLNQYFQRVWGEGDVFFIGQLQPTDKGRRVFEQCRIFFQRLQELEKTVWEPQRKNQVAVAASETVADFLLPRVAPRLGSGGTGDLGSRAGPPPDNWIR
jgi:hypothetical protein